MDFMTHLGHLLHFDGLLHWCILIALFGFLVSWLWIVVRILLPLRYLAQQTASIMEGELPVFKLPRGSVREVAQLKYSLQYMIDQIKVAQEREITYRNALTESQENERMRIARDIHDDTIQSLVLVAHNIERAAQSTEITPHLQKARNQLLVAIEGLRQIIADLRPTVLDELGLVIAIEMLCEKHPTLEFLVMGEVYEIAPSQELAIFRAAQEAIHNAERHAGAKRITVTLSYSQSSVILEVCDDGAGFQVPQQLQEFVARGHYGLMGIRERVLHLGGQINLFSELAVGTRVIVSVPAPLMHMT